MKLLIVAGGGGHFASALSVIEKLPKDWEILLVGRKFAFEGDQALSFEYLTAKKMGIPFRSLTTGRMQRKFSFRSITSLGKLPVGVIGGIKVIREFQPDVLLSFGGYVSVPVVLAAAFQKIPIVIHEQILGAGAANKFAAKFAKTVCVSWEESGKYFPSNKTVLTGIPLRNFSPSSRPSPLEGEGEYFPRPLGERVRVRGLPLLYITGGSGGAHAINILIEGCIEKLLKKFNVIHQTGDAKEFNDFERLEKVKQGLDKSLQERYEIRKFIEPDLVFNILQKTDLVVSRSGINTVSELLYFGKPAVLIPLPYGQKNEQQTNAEFIQKIGLAEVLEQQNLTAEKLYLKILEMFDNIDKYRKNSKKAKALIHADAAEKVLKQVKNAYHKKT